jgi:hypothetical protein
MGLSVSESGVLTDSQMNTVSARLTEASELTEVDFYICYYKGERYEYASYDEGANEIQLVICENTGYGDSYYYDIYTYGTAYTRLSDSDIDYILDHESVYDNIKSGRIYEGILGFIEVASGRLGTVSEENTKTLVIAGVISLTVGGIIALLVVISYKRKLKSPSYPLEKYARLNLTHRTDTFISRNVTRVKIQTSSSSGGRSGGGRSGGGGGGHRGGR